MLQFIENLTNAIPHPVPWGCVAIAIGFVLAGLAGPIKGRADKKRNSRNLETKNKSRWLQRLFIALLILGAVFTGFGTWLTVKGGEINAQKLFDETRRENDEARIEYRAELKRVLSALNAAKQEQTRLLTDEKIKGLQKDLLAWVDDFTVRKPDKQRQLEAAKLASSQLEIQITAEAAPVYSFMLRMVEESLRAYAKRTGLKIQIDVRPLPENYYQPNVNNPARIVHFPGDKQWRFDVIANAPAREEQPPRLDIDFYDNGRRRGAVWILANRGAKKLTIQGWGVLPTPDPSTIFGEYEIDDYEGTLGRVLQRLIEAELAQIP